jgi:hypothetical protein
VDLYLFHNATPVRSRLKVRNESGTNRARIGDSSPCLLRSPQHIAQIAICGTRSSLTRADKRWFGGEILKRFGWSESNQKRGRVKAGFWVCRPGQASPCERAPGPIPRDLSVGPSGRGLLQQFTPVAMGPRVRGDDAWKKPALQPSIRFRHARRSLAPSPRSCGEGVGVRGCFREIADRDTRGDSPSPELLRNSTSPRRRGEVDRSRSECVNSSSPRAAVSRW